MRRYSASAGFAVMLLLGVLIASTQVVAEPYAVRLSGGVSGRQFWFYSGNVNPVYNTLARDAIANDWNVISNSRISFTETTDYNSSEVDFYALPYGTTDWAGVTAHRLTGGTGVNYALGQPPYSNWDYAEVSLNDDRLANTALFPTTNKVKAVVSHEFGHAVGLDHEGDTLAHPCQLLNQFLLDDWNPSTGCAPSTTQTWDKVWARQLQ